MKLLSYFSLEFDRVGAVLHPDGEPAAQEDPGHDAGGHEEDGLRARHVQPRALQLREAPQPLRGGGEVPQEDGGQLSR